MKLTKKMLLAAALPAIIILSAAGKQGSAISADHIDRPFDWTVRIETQELPTQFQYAGCRLFPVVKTHVTYFKTHDESHTMDENHPVKYEDMWFHGEKPLGLERLHKFEVERGDAVSIEVTHKEGTGTASEYQAASNAILRLILESNLNANSVATVKLPEGSSFFEVVSCLEHQGATSAPPHDGSHPLASAINIFLESTPPGHTQTLYFF